MVRCCILIIIAYVTDEIRFEEVITINSIKKYVFIYPDKTSVYYKIIRILNGLTLDVLLDVI